MTPKSKAQEKKRSRKISITPKQQDFLDLIVRLIARDSVSPTLAELACELGVTKGTAAAYVRRLRTSGHLVNAKGRFRAIRPTTQVHA